MQCRARFDLVLLLGAFEHLPDQAAALTGAERVLAANGRVIIIAPHPWNPVFCIKRLIDGADDAPPSDHLSPLRLRGLALSHGLELSALRALPYAPWPAIGAVLDNGQSRPNRRWPTQSIGRNSAWRVCRRVLPSPLAAMAVQHEGRRVPRARRRSVVAQSLR